MTGPWPQALLFSVIDRSGSRLLVRALGLARLRNLLAGLGSVIIGFSIFYVLRGNWQAATGGAIVIGGLLGLAIITISRRQLPSIRALNMTLAITNAGAVIAIASLGSIGVAWIGPLVFINLLLGGGVVGGAFTLIALLLMVPLAGMHTDVDLIASLLGALLLSGIMAFATTVSLRDHLGRLQLEANQDALTGAVNRRGLTFAISSRLAEVDDERPMAVILMDVDRFKELNDRFGHTMGDTVLKRLVGVLKDNLRCNDVVYRYGGEEFIVVVDVAVENACRVAEKLIMAVSHHELLPEVAVTISAGVAEAQPLDTEQSLIHRADQALYRAKAAGRNRYAVVRSNEPT